MATNEPLRQVRRKIPWVEPLEAVRRLKQHSPLLLDGLTKHPESQRAFVACSPAVEVRVQDGTLSVQLEGAERADAKFSLAALQDLLDAWRFDIEEPEGFTGGWVGYFGYEALHWFEPGLPEPGPRSTPDLMLRLCRDALVFDRRRQTVTLITAHVPGETNAAARADQLLAALGTTAEDTTFAVLGPWTPSMDRVAFEAAVVALQEKIRTGDLYQANLATRFTSPFSGDSAALFAALQTDNPGPFMAFMDFGDHTIASASPEQLFAVQDGRIRSRPIAGTRRRGRDPAEDEALEQELLGDEKERAEHTMLLDLVRNDVARVAVPGTVHVPESMSVEHYRRVMHLVSRVEGDVAPGTGFLDWMAALFPGGTITGAPKHRACWRIGEAEPVARGPYTGSAGYLSWSHNAHWNILIRTAVVQNSEVHVAAGSGIVMDSKPDREWREAGHKAQALLEAGTAPDDPDDPGGVGTVRRHGTWNPQTPSAQTAARVLLVDNYDSFVWNLADYAAALGAEVRVVRNDEDMAAALDSFRPTHIILSPGPGRPEDSAATWVMACGLPGLPVLGVCLGHQAMAGAAGANVVVASEAVHGKSAAVVHDGVGLLASVPSPFKAARYHSLIVEAHSLPEDWQVTARLADGTIMAVQHRDRPWFGLQFHPESIGTNHGMDILQRFLEVT